MISASPGEIGVGAPPTPTAPSNARSGTAIGGTPAASEIERLSTDREKSGVPIGAHCVNPFNGEEVPFFVADSVLMGYGTGGVMAVPAPDSPEVRR